MGDDLAAYPQAIVGVYDNAAQYTQAPDDMKRPPVADAAYDWIDQRTASFTAVSAPSLGTHVVYVEWRGADGAVSHQRLWTFQKETTGVRLDLLTPKDGAALSPTSAAAFAALTRADVSSYGPLCGLEVTSNGRGAWNAQTRTDICAVTGSDGQSMTVDARVTVMPTGVLYQESARREDGAYVFRVPGGPPYDFRRRP